MAVGRCCWPAWRVHCRQPGVLAGRQRWLLIAARFAQAMGGGAGFGVGAGGGARCVCAQRGDSSVVAHGDGDVGGPAAGADAGQRGAGLGRLAQPVCRAVSGVSSTAVVAWTLVETFAARAARRLTLGQAFAAYGQMLRQPAAVGLLLVGGLSFAAMFAYITASPDFYGQQGWSPSAYALVFAARQDFTANFINRPPGALAGAYAGRVGCPGRFVGGAGDECGAGGRGASDGLVVGALAVAVSVTGLLGANCVGLLMRRLPSQQRGGGFVWRQPVWFGHAGQRGGERAARRQQPADGLGDAGVPGWVGSGFCRVLMRAR